MVSNRRIAPYTHAPFTLRHHACTLAESPPGGYENSHRGVVIKVTSLTIFSFRLSVTIRGVYENQWFSLSQM